MPILTLDRIAQLTGGQVVQHGHTVVSSVVIDSREANAGSLFVAIRGERLDGHDFLAEALKTGAGALVSRVPVAPPGRGLVRVDDTTAALQRLASEVRGLWPHTMVAVTGSAGKTTTKEMIAALVATERRTWKSWGNLNNQIGCPLCVANTPDGTEVVVAELGMSAKGEIAFLAQIVKPDIAVYTNVAPVHLEFFDSIEGIAEAKRELMESLSPDGTVIVNADDPRVAAIGEAFGGRKVRYGVDAEDVDVHATSLESMGLRGTRVVIEAEGSEHVLEIPLAGRHNVENFLAAVATARVLGVSWDGVRRGTAEIRPASHRGVVIPWRGATLYDDTYNSNPSALRRAVELLVASPCDGRRIAVIGDMLELGRDERKFHFDAGHDLPRGVNVVVAVGERSRSLLLGARSAGFAADDLHHFGDALESVSFLRDSVRPGDLVLLKASRGIGLDRVIRELEREG